jgi:FkbM family methyltransferase
MDLRKNLLFIGANDMREIRDYVRTYKNGLFVEAIPATFERLKLNLLQPNTNYKAINSLVTSEPGKTYKFNVFSNMEASSSIYEPNETEWMWNHIHVTHQIDLVSTTVANLLSEEGWEDKRYDLVLDVQGAELEVLKGFGKSNLANIDMVVVEVSTKQFYKGGVLFDELNAFFIQNGFKLRGAPSDVHTDVVYDRQVPA